MLENNSGMTAVKNIFLNIVQTIQTRFLDMNLSEIAYPYLLINIAAFIILLRLGLSVNYLRKQPGQEGQSVSFKNILQSIFSAEVFLSRSFRVDVGIFLTNLILFGMLTVLISDAITDPTSFFLEKINNGLIYLFGTHQPTSISPLLESFIFTVISFFIYETLYYFAHRACHAFPVLWQFHKVHHSTTHLNFMTDNRFHAVEWFGFFVYLGFSAAFSKSICVYLFGGVPEMIAVHGIMIHYAIFYSLTLAQHSNLWLSFGRFDYVVVSPAMHIMHHSTDPKNFNTNYALNLSTLDWLFGTLKKTAKKPPENLEIGLGANVQENYFWANAPLLAYFSWPFKEVCRLFVRLSKLN